MTIDLRPASVDDCATIVRFNCAMALETEELTLDPRTIAGGVERLLRDPSRGLYFLAERSGHVVGQLMITREWSDWRNGWWWWIQSVYVAPRARREGVYASLYRHARSEAEAVGAIGLRLYVDRDNTGARATYKAMGMRQSRYRFYEAEFSDNKER